MTPSLPHTSYYRLLKNSIVTDYPDYPWHGDIGPGSDVDDHVNDDDHESDFDIGDACFDHLCVELLLDS